jgi:hypothetical protein
MAAVFDFLLSVGRATGWLSLALVVTACLVLVEPGMAGNPRPAAGNAPPATGISARQPARGANSTSTGGMPSGESVEMTRLLMLMLAILVFTVVVPVQVAKWVATRRREERPVRLARVIPIAALRRHRSGRT